MPSYLVCYEGNTYTCNTLSSGLVRMIYQTDILVIKLLDTEFYKASVVDDMIQWEKIRHEG